MRGSIATPVSLLVAAMTALAGCTAPPPTQTRPLATPSAANPYAQRIDEALARATTSFEREVLTRAQKTGRIDPADYRAARQRELECLKNKGHEAILTEDSATGLTRVALLSSGGAAPTAPGSGPGDDDVTECQHGTSGLIAELYESMVVNPTGVDPRQALVTCLVEKKVYPPGFTVDDLDRELARGAGANSAPSTSVVSSTETGDGNGTTITGSGGALPKDHPLMSQAAQECFARGMR